MTRTRLIQRALYVVPLVGAMVFGATQVFASPTAAPGDAERACSKRCWTECGPAGGVCNAYGVCVCY